MRLSGPGPQGKLQRSLAAPHRHTISWGTRAAPKTLDGWGGHLPAALVPLELCLASLLMACGAGGPGPAPPATPLPSPACSLLLTMALGWGDRNPGW